MYVLTNPGLQRGPLPTLFNIEIHFINDLANGKRLNFTINANNFIQIVMLVSHVRINNSNKKFC